MQKLILNSILFILLSVAVQVQATPRYWKSIGLTGQNGLWTNGKNWADSMTVAPQAGDVVYILNRAGDWNTIACNFTTTLISLDALRVGDSTVGIFGGTAVMNMSSGSITTAANEVMVGAGSVGKGVLNMSGGSITTSANGYFVVGQAGGNGTLNMTGGTITANNFWVSNQANSKGSVHLDGGTINIKGSISIQGNNDAGNKTEASGSGLIDITGGKIVFQKNEDLTWLADYLAGMGLMTSYDGAGTFVSTRDGNGYTTITAVAPVVLLKGDINKDWVVDMYDLFILTQQWLSVPGTPSADISPSVGDGKIDLRDFAVFADDFNYLNTVTYDFVANASSAVWTSQGGTVTFGAAWSDTMGAAVSATATLEDGVSASQIRTFPDANPGFATHFMKGTYSNITVPEYPGRVKFTTSVGFVDGATGTEGVTFRFIINRNGMYYELAAVDAEYDGLLNTLSADLTAYKGETLTFILEAEADGSSAFCWAAWKDAKIVTYNNPVEVVYDFVANASKGTYVTGTGTIPWGNNNSNGAGYITTGNLENNQSYTSLFTHPDSGDASSHFINSTFSNVIIPNNVVDIQFTAKVGFASGASGTDGVTFNVYVIRDTQSALLCTKTKTYDGTLATITGNLSGYQGQNITLMLQVLPGTTVFSDWACWTEAKITGQLPTQLYVRDFGAVANDGIDDLAALTTAASNAKAMQPAEIYFDDGTYNISNIWTVAGLRNTNVKGYSHDTPTTIINSNPAAGTFLYNSCRNVTTRNFTIDYNPLPFTQGTISNLSGNTFTLTIDAGYPELNEARFTSNLSLCLGLYKDISSQSVAGRVIAGGPDYTTFPVAPVRVSAGIYTVQVTDTTNIANGNKFVYAKIGDVVCGAAWDLTSQHVWDNITLHSGPGMAFASSSYGKIFVRNCNVIIKPGTNRLQSTHADGVHTNDQKNGPDISNSTFEGMEDDGVNINSSGGRILAQTSSTRFSIYSAHAFSIGERLILFKQDTGTLGYASGVTVTIRHDPVIVQVGGVNYSCEDVEVNTAPASSVTVGWDNDKMFSLDFGGDNYLIKDCTFRNYRGRGILANGFNGVITNNTFTGLSSGAIRIANGSSWNEGLVSRNITIKNNTITDCSLSIGNAYWPYSGQICVAANNGNDESTSASIIQGPIFITNNIITNWPRNAIYVGSSDSVTISGNTMTNYYPSVGPKSSSGWRGTMFFDNCSNIAVTGNTVVDQRPSSGTYLINGVLFRKGFTGNLTESGNSFADNYSGSNVRDVTSY